MPPPQTVHPEEESPKQASFLQGGATTFVHSGNNTFIHGGSIGHGGTGTIGDGGTGSLDAQEKSPRKSVSVLY